MCFWEVNNKNRTLPILSTLLLFNWNQERNSTSSFPEVTLSALNAPENDVDIEGLGDGGASKKLDFDSGNRSIFTISCFSGGIGCDGW